jgi:hypothetical protein
MTYFLGFCLLLALGLSLFVFLGPKLPSMHEGMWEISAETKMPGMPEPTIWKNMQRLTKDDHVPDISIPGYTCQIQEHKYRSYVLGNHVLWSIICEGPKTIYGSGHIKYSGDVMKGKIQLNTTDENEGQKRFNAYVSGFRIGSSE